MGHPDYGSVFLLELGAKVAKYQMKWLSCALGTSAEEDVPRGQHWSCPREWCRNSLVGLSEAGRAACYHASAVGSMRARSSRSGAMVSRVM
jgi:hypothetical protein